MKTLIWHWGRRGAGPLFAARMAAALRDLPGQQACLSLAAGAEILSAVNPPPCDWREPTYTSPLGYAAQRLLGPFVQSRTRQHVQALAPDAAICAMPALLDGRMRAALEGLHVPYGVVVHDAAAHPGEALRFQVLGQQRLLRRARWLFALSGHVESGLRAQGFGGAGQTLVKLWHPPFGFDEAIPPRQATTRPRLLYFGRLLPYKGLDLLADALELLGPSPGFDLRVCGDGPASPSLARLRALPGVSVEQRWFADGELPELLTWSDALVLPYREASQSGVAALAIAAGRQVLATRVGGLPEQLGGISSALLCAPEPPAIAEGIMTLVARLREEEANPPAVVDANGDWREMMAAAVAAMSGHT
jgi:glycosyltransferase involved in cell wall biosynthesis